MDDGWNSPSDERSSVGNRVELCRSNGGVNLEGRRLISGRESENCGEVRRGVRSGRQCEKGAQEGDRGNADFNVGREFGGGGGGDCMKSSAEGGRGGDDSQQNRRAIDKACRAMEGNFGGGECVEEVGQAQERNSMGEARGGGDGCWE